jgi:hypothetical protein
MTRRISCPSRFARKLHRSRSMSISRGSSPVAEQAPPHCAGSLARCRVGDWVYPADTFEWWGRRGIQCFQPQARNAFDPTAFDPSGSVWRFERCEHPSFKFSRGQSCQVWKRIA